MPCRSQGSSATFIRDAILTSVINCLSCLYEIYIELESKHSMIKFPYHYCTFSHLKGNIAFSIFRITLLAPFIWLFLISRMIKWTDLSELYILPRCLSTVKCNWNIFFSSCSVDSLLKSLIFIPPFSLLFFFSFLR